MINKIHLKNFKIFEDEEFEIAPLTLITGINGMGKSSIIQALLLLKQSYQIGYLQTKNQVDLSNDYIDLESAESLRYAMASSGEQNVSISLTINDENTHTWSIDTTSAKAKILDCSYQGSGNLEDVSLFDDNFIFLEAERWGPRSTYDKKVKRAYNTKLGIQGELTPSYLLSATSTNEEIGIEKMKHPNVSEGSKQLYANLNEWMAEIVNIPLKANVTEIEEAKVKLTYNIEGNKGKSFSALQVGFGLTFCLPIVVALLRARKGDLIIIENPEAHLHPSAQVRLGKLICLAASLGVQIIVESHSDHILNSIRYSYKDRILLDNQVNILFISRLESKEGILPDVDYIKISQSGRLSHRPSDFFDTWDNMLTKLF